MKEQVPEWLKNKDYFNNKKDAAIEIRLYSSVYVRLLAGTPYAG